jgi:transcriptional regulator with XRE-family HTH domain
MTDEELPGEDADAKRVAMTIFAKKLRHLMKRRPGGGKVAQQALADAVGVSQNLISLWTRSLGHPPDIFEGLAMAKALDVDLRYLADDEMEAPAPGLTEEDRRILAMVHVIGHEEAMVRLMRADGGGDAGRVEMPPKQPIGKPPTRVYGGEPGSPKEPRRSRPKKNA